MSKLGASIRGNHHTFIEFTSGNPRGSHGKDPRKILSWHAEEENRTIFKHAQSILFYLFKNLFALKNVLSLLRKQFIALHIYGLMSMAMLPNPAFFTSTLLPPFLSYLFSFIASNLRGSYFITAKLTGTLPESKCPGQKEQPNSLPPHSHLSITRNKDGQSLPDKA